MRAAGIVGVSRRRGTVVTTRRDKDARPAPDLVDRDFSASAPNQLWVADITFIPTAAGFLYLAVVLDAFSRRIVGWAMAATERLAQDWDFFDRREQLNCAMVAALHKGTLYLFRSYVYSADLNVVAGLVDINRSQSQTGSATFVTGEVQRELTGTPWITRFQRVEMGLGDRNQLAGIDVFRLEPRED